MNFISSFIHRRIGHRSNLVKIIHNIGWLSFDKILRMSAGFFVGLWIVRYLGPEQFGLLSFATAFVGLFGAFATLGLQGIVVREIVLNTERAPEILGTTAILQLIGGIATYLLILVAITYLRPDDAIARTIVAILGSTTLFKASEISVYWFEYKVLSKYTVWVQNGIFLFFVAVKIIAILEQASLIAFVWIIMAEAMFTAIMLLGIMNIKHNLLFTKLRVSTKCAKSLLKNSWPLLLSGLSISLYMKIDQIMIQEMLGKYEVGIYSAAVKLTEAWYFIPMVIAASLYPTLVKYKQESEMLFYEKFQNFSDLLFYLSLPIAGFIIIFNNQITLLLLDANYIDSSAVLAIYALGGIVVALAVAQAQFWITFNLQKQLLIITAGSAFLNIILNYFMIPVYGVEGAALSTVISNVIGTLFLPYFVPQARKMLFHSYCSLNFIKFIKCLTTK